MKDSFVFVKKCRRKEAVLVQRTKKESTKHESLLPVEAGGRELALVDLTGQQIFSIAPYTHTYNGEG